MEYNGSTYQLTILDTAGLESYSAIPSNYITNTNGYILVYSINDRQSFETIQDIYNRLVEANNRV
jgi:GTPase SAR1 family protein